MSWFLDAGGCPWQVDKAGACTPVSVVVEIMLQQLSHAYECGVGAVALSNIGLRPSRSFNKTTTILADTSMFN